MIVEIAAFCLFSGRLKPSMDAAFVMPRQLTPECYGIANSLKKKTMMINIAGIPCLPVEDDGEKKIGDGSVDSEGSEGEKKGLIHVQDDGDQSNRKRSMDELTIAVTEGVRQTVKCRVGDIPAGTYQIEGFVTGVGRAASTATVTRDLIITEFEDSEIGSMAGKKFWWQRTK